MNCRLVPSVVFGMMILLAVGAANAQTLSVNPQSLSFVYQIGGVNPAAQALYLSGATPTQFSASTSGVPWLTVTPSSGMTPATLTVSVVPPPNAAPGILNGTIIIGPAASVDAVRLVVPVSLQIVAAPQGNLLVTPGSLVADYQIGGPVPTLPPLSVTSTGGQAAFSVATSTSSGGLWLSVGATGPVTPAFVNVAITPPIGMTPGVYTGTISVIPSSGGGTTRLVSVTLRVSSAGALVPSPSWLTFEHQVGAPNPDAQYLRVSHSSGTVVPFTVSVNTPSGMWLSVTPTSAVTPTSISVRVLATSLMAGAYYGTITLQPSTGPPSQIPVNLVVTNTPQLTVMPPTVTLDYQLGTPPLPAQYLHVTSTGSPVSFSASVTGPDWIKAATGVFTTPTGLAISVNPPATTLPGTYNATVALDPVGGGDTRFVQVTTQIRPANVLSLSQKELQFLHSPGATLPNQMVSVASSGESTRFQAAGSSSWITVSQTASYTPASLSIGVNPQGLAPGTYRDRINVFADGASNSPQTIDVTLSVVTEPTFSAAPFGLMFSYQIGSAPPPVQLAVVTNSSPSQNFSISAETAAGGNWLRLAGGGTAPAAIAAAIDTDLFKSPGTYTGNIVVTPSTASTPVLRIPVVVHASLGPALRTTANLVAFQYEIGGPAPAPQKIPVASTGAAVGFYTSLRSADGAPWLRVTPEFGSSPTDVTVTVDPSGLTQGTYLGLIALTGVGPESIIYYVPVSLQVSSTPILAVPAQSVFFSAQVGRPRPATQTIKVSNVGPPVSFSATAASAGWLRVEPTTAVGTADFSLQAIPDAFSAGFYLGLLTVQIPGVPGSEQYVPTALWLENSPPPATVDKQ